MSLCAAKSHHFLFTFFYAISRTSLPPYNWLSLFAFESFFYVWLLYANDIYNESRVHTVVHKRGASFLGFLVGLVTVSAEVQHFILYQLLEARSVEGVGVL